MIHEIMSNCILLFIQQNWKIELHGWRPTQEDYNIDNFWLNGSQVDGVAMLLPKSVV